MRIFEGKQDLAAIIDFYKQGKITKYALEIELAKAINPLILPCDCVVNIVDDTEIKSNSNFVPFMVPEFNEFKGSVIYIVGNSLFNLIDSTEVLDMLEVISMNSFDVSKELKSFILSKEHTNISVYETIILTTKQYIKALETIKASMTDVYNELVENNNISPLNKIVELLRSLENDEISVQDFKERAIIVEGLPNEIFERSKYYATKIYDGYKEPEVVIAYSDETPIANLLRNKIKVYSDETFSEDKLSKKIPYDYYPETNQ